MADPRGGTRSAAVLEIRKRFVKLSDVRMPKYLQVRKAILASVEDGVLGPGEQLPPEDDLTSALGVSLGTIRRALGHLAAGGVVTREHGRGTFIAQHHRAIDDSWHYRFLAEDGKTLLPVYSNLLERGVIDESGPWVDALGEDDEGYVRIQRCFNVNDEFFSYSEFYLRASQFGGMLKLPLSKLESVNLKKVLNEEFGAPTVYVDQQLRAQRFSEPICELMSMGKRTHGLFLQVVAYSYDNLPISYHMICIPPTKYLLDLSTHDPSKRAAAAIT